MSARTHFFQKMNLFRIGLLLLLATIFLMARLFYIMTVRNEYYSEQAQILHERERSVKAARGRILDRYGNVLADNERVCTVSVIHNQIEDRDRVVKELVRILDMEEEKIAKRVDKVSSIERIKSNVPILLGNEIKALGLSGVKVDEDYKRFYPYDDLASKILGFTGSDNQGIIGLEVKYDDILKGSYGTIYTLTDAKGIELPDEVERRENPVDGKDLVLTLDLNIQTYAAQLARQAMEQHNADSVSILVMNPNNGEIYACVNEPEFHLNSPYELLEPLEEGYTKEEYENALNAMWRNGCINDTYEPGSVFKIVTASAALESGSSTLSDRFYCPGYIMVEDRRIRCHKTVGHGSQDFTEATMNSCKQGFGFDNFFIPELLCRW